MKMTKLKPIQVTKPTQPVEPKASGWIKATVHLKRAAGPLTVLSQRHTAAFEKHFKIKSLYFARYSDLSQHQFEVSAKTQATFRQIKDFFRKCLGVSRVEVEWRGTGSEAHACAYQAVKRLPGHYEDAAQDREFVDVIHWMCNMRGLDYARELRFYGYATLVVAQVVISASEANLVAMEADRLVNKKSQPEKSQRQRKAERNQKHPGI
jgi:hypothetical protein